MKTYTIVSCRFNKIITIKSCISYIYRRLFVQIDIKTALKATAPVYLYIGH